VIFTEQWVSVWTPPQLDSITSH